MTLEDLQVSKSVLRKDQTMSDAAYVDEASGWVRTMVARESRGPGDTENAMRRLETRHGVPFHTLWSLRYRKPKGLFVSVYVRLHAAYRTECARQLQSLRHDLEATKAIAGAHHHPVASAEAFLREVEGDASEQIE